MTTIELIKYFIDQHPQASALAVFVIALGIGGMFSNIGSRK